MKTIKINHEDSFDSGMRYARDLMINLCADIADQNPMFARGVSRISDELNDEIYDALNGLKMWGAQTIVFENAKKEEDDE